MSRQDRQGARTVSDLERRYNFEKSFAEVMGIASDARNEAQEAKKVASSIAETDEGLKIKVKALDDEMVTVKAELDMSVKTDEEGNLTSKMHIGADLLTIDTGNFFLDESGTASSNHMVADNMTSRNMTAVNATISSGKIAGWTIDKWGIHQTRGWYGNYTVTDNLNNTTYNYTGHYLFYCMEISGLYVYIFPTDNFDATQEYPSYVHRSSLIDNSWTVKRGW